MTDVPAILAAIGLHLDIDSLLACTTVCRQWSAVFAPCIWHNFGITRKLWRHLLDSRGLSKTGEEGNFIEQQERLTALMKQHSQHIRHLTVEDKMVFIAALEAPLTGLHSLTLELDFWELDADDEESDINKSNTWISMMLATIVEKSPLELMVPEAAFAGGDQARLNLTRAYWLVVFMNSALRRLSRPTYREYSSLCYVNLLATQPPKEQEGAYIDTGADQLASPHQALRILNFQKVSITASQLRATVVAFPDLHQLSIKQARSRILKNNYYKFPRITEIDRSVPIKSAYELRQLLWAFPALERLDSEYELGDRAPLRAEEIIYEEDREYRLRSLNINTSSFTTCDLDSCIAQMPFLVLLEISEGFLDGRVLTELARTCKDLQYARFDLQGECSQELNALFVRCSKLKKCLGKGHKVRAEDIIDGPEWSCRGIEELDMKVVGVPWLSAWQMHVLDKMGGNPETDVEREVLELDKEMRRIQSIISHRLEPLTKYTRITRSIGL
ncbi:hypothetical protein BGZ47_007693 [Haplosporangium gracile]|nr:hypothetical protein BGZ47_007693 [Haplosporangium gracile]